MQEYLGFCSIALALLRNFWGVELLVWLFNIAF